jgi:Rrf2 family protein
MLSKKCKYAIHALVHMAKEPEKKFLIKDISEACNIPKKFLEAILLELKRAGVLGSKQGKGGGYFLRQDPATVNLAEVLRMFDGTIALVSCAAHKFYEPCAECEDEATCSLHHAFLEIRMATVDMLKNETLEGLAKKELKMKAKKKAKA